MKKAYIEVLECFAMASNFLGGTAPQITTAIISGNELIAREGVNLTKGMNFRDGRTGLAAVFLVLPSHDGEFRDEWNKETLIYVYEGHDSTTVESGKQTDQLMMYESGKITDNGKFYKAAHAFKDGLVKTPLQIHVYEKLDPGVWYSKGIFNLIDAMRVSENGRKVFKFHLMPAQAFETGELADERSVENMLPANVKAVVWERAGGRCESCKEDKDLRFVPPSDYETSVDEIRLLCRVHRGGKIKRGLLE